MLRCLIKVTLSFLITNLCFSQEYNSKNVTNYMDSIANLKVIDHTTLAEAEKKLQQYDTIAFSKELGLAYHEIGKMYYANEQYKKAIAITYKAIALKRKAKDTFQVNKSLNNLYYYLEKSGADNKEQLTALEQIIECKALDIYTIRAHNKAAKIYTERGDFFKALHYYNFVISNYLTHNNTDQLSEAHLGCIEVYSRLKIEPSQLNKIQYHNQQIEIYADYILEEDIAKNNNNLANIYEDIGLNIEAVVYYKKALDYYLETEESETTGAIYSNLGQIYSKLKNTQKATFYFNKALSTTKNKNVLADVAHNRGFYLETTQPTDKIPYYQASMRHLLNKKYNNTTLDDLPSETLIKESNNSKEIIEDLIQIANTWVLAFEKNGETSNLLRAKKTLFLIDKIISYIRFESSLDKSKLFWISKGVDSYMLGVKACYLLGDIETAFYFMEKNKALLVLENLNYTEDNELPIASLNSTKKQLVSSSSNFIEYIINDEEGYGIFYSDNDVSFFKIDNVPLLLNKVEKYKKMCSVPFTNKGDDRIYVENANEIFQKLFPFKNALQEISDKKLTVISDYKIKNIAFEALQINNKTENLSSSFLIQHAEISYLYSASVFTQLQKRKRKSTQSVLGIAPENFKMDSLTRLENSALDIKKIASLFPTTILEKEEATKSAILANMNDYAIIHINTHAGIDTLTKESWLAFYDQKMNLNEIYNHPFLVDLVVLDACKTGVGKIAIGEGVMSLSRGFTYSGAKSVIASQWNANENTNSKIFETFYKELHKGTSKSTALHKSKIAYLNTHQLSEISPYYWASMTLTGNTDSINNSPSTNRWLFFLIPALIILFYFLYTIYSSKR